MRIVLNKKEEGQFGLATILFAIAAFILVIFINWELVHYSWLGFVTNMKPDALYPSLLNSKGFPISKIELNNGFKSILYGSIWLQQNIVMRYIVNVLFLLLLLFVGIAYLYFDLFERFLNTRLKEFIPRIVFGLILAYGGIYVLEALMYFAKGGYVLFYDLPHPFNAWQDPDFLAGIGLPQLTPKGSGMWSSLMGSLASNYIRFIWVFIAGSEAIILLVLVAVRDMLFGVVLVLLPIASLLLIHPWTERIGSRLWWLSIDLLFLPVVMIIPLALMGLVHNSVSFTIAGLTVTIGTLYLISREPMVLSGAGFTRGGEVLRGGVQGGMLGGSIITPGGLERRGSESLAGAHRAAATSLANWAGERWKQRTGTQTVFQFVSNAIRLKNKR